MSIFDYDDYKKGVNAWIQSQPSHGHGQLRRLAAHLGVNSVVMSQVFRGHRQLTLEQAVKVANFIGLKKIERDYFLLLVQKERVGSYELKIILTKQLEKMQDSLKLLKNRISHEKLSEEDKATFYSHWYYSAIRLGTSFKKLNTISELAQHLNLERDLVAKVVEFLLKNKLIVEGEKGLNIGPQVTHVGHDSPFVVRHHVNWRLQSLKSMEYKNNSENLFYTGPMALSENAAKKIRKLLLNLVDATTKEASNSESEALHCLNIDWFKIGQ